MVIYPFIMALCIQQSVFRLGSPKWSHSKLHDQAYINYLDHMQTSTQEEWVRVVPHIPDSLINGISNECTEGYSLTVIKR